MRDKTQGNSRELGGTQGKSSLTPVSPLPSLLTTLITLTIYLLTLAPDLTWANFGTDGGELITAAVTLGIPHPPGYPTYVLLGKLISFIPIGTMAYRFNLFSAVCVAGAAGFITAIVGRTARGEQPVAGDKGQKAGAIAAGLCLAFAPLVWGQAIITEVYGLNLLVVAALLWTLLGKRPSPTIIGLLFGLSLTTHLTSSLLLPLILSLTPRTQWSKLALGLPLGLLPLLTVPLIAHSSSPVIWGQPDTIKGWWWLISGSLYRPNLLTAAWQSRLLPFTRLLLTQFTILTLPLTLPSLFTPRPSPLAPHPSSFALLLTTFLYFLYTLTYNTHDAHISLLPAILILSILIGYTLQHLGPFALILPLALLLINFNEQNLREEQTIRPSAIQQLQTAPANAILLMSGEGTLFTLWYFQHVEGLRPDLILVDENLFAFDWRRQQLQNRYPNVAWPNGYDLETLILEANRPICYLNQLQSMDCYE